MKKSLYEQVVETGCEFSSWQSDFYFPVNAKTTAIVEKYEWKKNVRIFRDQITGAKWYDVPFAYDPYYTALKEERK